MESIMSNAERFTRMCRVILFMSSTATATAVAGAAPKNERANDSEYFSRGREARSDVARVQ
jgi:hypothetical protein